MNMFSKWVVACAFVATTILTSHQTATAQSQQYDTSYINQDTFFVTFLNVQNLLKYEKPDSKLRKDFAEMLKKNAKFDIADLKEMRFQLTGKFEGEAKESDMEDMIFMRFEFFKDIDVDAVMRAMVQNGEEAEHKGKKYFKPNNKYSPSAYAPDKRTILVAKDEQLTSMMDKPDSMGGMVEQIRKLKNDNDISIAFVHNETTKKFVESIKKEMK